MISRHRISASQMQRPQALGVTPIHARRGRAHGCYGQRKFLSCDGAVGSDLTGCDAQFLLAEDVGGEDVDHAHDDDDDAAGDDDAPVGCAEGFLGCGFFV